MVCGKVTPRVFGSKGVPVFGNRLFGLPREGDTHRQPLEVVETADVRQRGWAPVSRLC